MRDVVTTDFPASFASIWFASLESIEDNQEFEVDWFALVAAPVGNAELDTTTAPVFTAVTLAFNADNVDSVAAPVGSGNDAAETGTAEARSCVSVNGPETGTAVALSCVSVNGPETGTAVARSCVSVNGPETGTAVALSCVSVNGPETGTAD